MTTNLPKLAQRAITEARQGNLDRALTLAKEALADHTTDQGLLLFVGMLHSRRSEPGEAAEYFRQILGLSPDDAIARLELARALIALNQLDEAEALLGSMTIKGSEQRRLRALSLMRRDQHGEAAAMYQAIVSADGRDFESWGNLGICRLMTGNVGGAVAALEEALTLRRDQQRFRDKWAEAQVRGGMGEQGLSRAIFFSTEKPDDVLVRVTIARLEDLLGRPERALAALGEALALDPSHAPALSALAMLHERGNRLDESAQAIARLEELRAVPPELSLLKAQLAFRRGDMALALELANAAPATLAPGAKAHLLGKIHDRIGNTTDAFAAFEEMNRDTGLATDVSAARAKSFRDALGERRATVTRQWVRNWRRGATPAAARSPVFLVGFPRSGTTLLDTMLMGHDELCIAEEKPMLDSVARAVGDYSRIDELTEAECNDLRELYYREAEAHVPELGTRILVDKQPFAMIEAALIHRIFPNARFIFAQRHPCDVVLSCFITRFEPNDGLLNLTTLEGAAQLYEEIMDFWAQLRAVLPLIVHSVRYERLIDEPASELEATLSFLGLGWNGGVLDLVSNATDRGFINTPSYAQVAEPLYDRSINRWERYRQELRPVLQRLNKWSSVMGYTT